MGLDRLRQVAQEGGHIAAAGAFRERQREVMDGPWFLRHAAHDTAEDQPSDAASARLGSLDGTPTDAMTAAAASSAAQISMAR